MKDQDKTRKQPISELTELRQQIAELKAAEAERRRTEELLQEERETFFSILQKAPYGVLLIDQDERCLYVNPEFTRITGRTLDEIPRVRDWFQQAFPDPAYRAEIIEQWKSDTVQRISRVFRVVCGDGEVKDVEFRPTLLDSGRAILVLSDVTKRKRAEEALQESEEKFRSLAEQSPNMIFINKKGRVVYANKRCEEATGYTREEFYSADFSFLTLIAPEHRESVEARFSKHMRGEELEPYDFALVAKDGTRVEVMAITKLIDYAGERAILGTVIDITERKRAEEETRQRALEQETLREAMLTLTITLDRDEVIDRILAQLQEVVPYDTASVQLLREGCLEIVGGRGFPNLEELLGITFDPKQEDNPNREVVYTRAPFIVDDAPTVYEEFLRGPHAPAGIRSWLGVPMLVRERLIGMIALDKSEPGFYTREHARLAEAFAAQAAIAIENARLYERAQQEITERKRAEEALRDSEERYRTVVEYQTDLICRFLPDGTLTFVNKACCRYFGKTREELIGHSFMPLILEEDRERTARYLASFSRRKPVATIERRVVAAGGKVRWQQWIDRPIFDEQGHLIEFQSVGRDITERKWAEEEQERLLVQVREQAQRVRQIIDTVPEGVLLLDAGRQVVLANPVAEENLSVLAAAKVGDTLTRLGDRPLEELLTSPPKGLWHAVEVDGRSFQIIARPIETGPATEGWVIVTWDDTQQREVEQRIQQQEKLAAVGQLAAGIAHDFNNIMATIILYAQMTARMEGLPDQVRERMATINQQSEYATKLIRQVLDFSRRSVLERRPLDLLPFLKEQVILLERTLPESIKIRLDYGPDEYTVNADLTSMQQTVMNLAVNARDAMPEGGKLRIGLERIEVKPGKSPLLPEMEAGEWVQMTVSDTGMGIRPEDLRHIFEPFFTTKGPGLGSGLGLAQVHGIVAQHEGHIAVDTWLGQGTTFIIYLPALPSHLPEPPTLEVKSLAKGQKETILVVEDNAATRQALVECLELLNYRALEATNGQEALAIAEELGDEIGLVLSDVVMPGMGGVALLHGLRERGLAVPVVMLTGHPLEKEMENLRAQGLLEWLLKPPRLEELAEVVARALSTD